MNEMYEMSQNIHIYSVIAMVFTLMLMMVLHKSKGEQESFVKTMAISMVFYASFIGSTALTGMIMMAAKHLSFTAANILMIVALLAVIVLEVKRNKVLKMLVKYKRVELDVYKKVAINFEVIELAIILGVSAFAGMAG